MGPHLKFLASLSRFVASFGRCGDLRRAREMLNRYIDGGRKRAQTTDLRGVENS